MPQASWIHLSLSPNAKFAALSSGKQITVIDLQDGAETTRNMGSSDLKVLAVGDQGQVVWSDAEGLLWDGRGEEPVVYEANPGVAVSAIVFHPQADRLFTANAAGGVQIWDTVIRTKLFDLAESAPVVKKLCISRSGEYVAGIRSDEIVIWRGTPAARDAN